MAIMANDILMMFFIILVFVIIIQLLRLSETLFATAPSVTTLRFACMVLIALRAFCLSEAA